MPCYGNKRQWCSRLSCKEKTMISPFLTVICLETITFCKRWRKFYRVKCISFTTEQMPHTPAHPFLHVSGNWGGAGRELLWVAGSLCLGAGIDRKASSICNSSCWTPGGLLANVPDWGEGQELIKRLMEAPLCLQWEWCTDHLAATASTELGHPCSSLLSTCGALCDLCPQCQSWVSAGLMGFLQLLAGPGLLSRAGNFKTVCEAEEKWPMTQSCPPPASDRHVPIQLPCACHLRGMTSTATAGPQLATAGAGTTQDCPAQFSCA